MDTLLQKTSKLDNNITILISMKFAASSLLLFLVVADSSDSVEADNAATLVDLPSTIFNGVRRHLNFNGLFGSPTRPTNLESHTSYEKIMGNPVFQVTTSWGSAYMNMEQLSEEDAKAMDKQSGMLAKSTDQVSSVGSQDNKYRTISLYYMDPDDAIAAHAEFKQMDGMRDTDVRITTVSLAKAIRSAANLGQGLLTGQPIDFHKGTVLPPREGGSLRHKILPPKKQLFYAARCHGKERIGLFGNDGEESKDQAVAAVIGNAALSYRNAQRKQAIRDRKLAYQPKNQLEADYKHMDGHLGIPVFYAAGMERRKSRIKSLVSGAERKEIPLFFNYEDLEKAWQKTKSLDKDKYLPNEIPQVEVFNLWDVLTSMEKEQARKQQKLQGLTPQNRLLQSLAHPFQNRMRNVLETSGSDDDDDHHLLDSLVFIPSSDACSYKEGITARGNSQARLPRMRKFGGSRI